MVFIVSVLNVGVNFQLACDVFCRYVRPWTVTASGPPWPPLSLPFLHQATQPFHSILGNLFTHTFHWVYSGFVNCFHTEKTHFALRLCPPVHTVHTLWAVISLSSQKELHTYSLLQCNRCLIGLLLIQLHFQGSGEMASSSITMCYHVWQKTVNGTQIIQSCQHTFRKVYLLTSLIINSTTPPKNHTKWQIYGATEYWHSIAKYSL